MSGGGRESGAKFERVTFFPWSVFFPMVSPTVLNCISSGKIHFYSVGEV